MSQRARRRWFYAGCVLTVVGWAWLLGPAAALAAAGICILVAVFS